MTWLVQLKTDVVSSMAEPILPQASQEAGQADQKTL